MNDQHELVLALSRAVDKVREDTGEPVWVPLEALLPAEWLSGWMFMQAREARTIEHDTFNRRMVFSYKHGITRRYLHIGDNLDVYRYAAERCEISDPLYIKHNTEWMITVAYHGIEDQGAERTTAYNAEFIAERNRRLRAAGFEVIY